MAFANSSDADTISQQPHIFPAGSSILAHCIRAFDWSQTPLGPIDEWPSILRHSVNLMLQSPVPMVILWGVDGIMLYNDGYIAVAGKRHPSALGSKVRESWPEISYFNGHVLEVCLAGGTLEYYDQELLLYRNGLFEPAWFNLTYSPIFDDESQAVGVLAVVVETTERVRQEQRRHDAEERINLALDAGPLIGTWVWDIQNDVFSSDARFAISFGLDPAEAVKGMPIDVPIQSIHPEDRQRIVDLISQTVVRGGSYRAEYRARQFDGSYRWVEAIGYCEHDDQGRPYRFPGLLIDIVDRKLARAAFEQSEAQLRTIFDTLPVGIVLAEAPSGRIIGGNARVEQILRHPVLPSSDKYAYHEWIAYDEQGKLVPIEEYPLFLAISTGETAEREFHYQRGDGTRLWIRVLGAPVRDVHGDIIGALITIIDIDREKRADAEQAFLLAFGDRLRTLTHTEDVLQTVTTMLGQYLEASRVGYAEINASGVATLGYEWADDALPNAMAEVTIDDFGATILETLKAGHTIRSDDLDNDMHPVIDGFKEAFANIKARSGLAVPLLKGDQSLALIYAYKVEPFAWQEEHEYLLRAVAERTWNAIERVRAEERLRSMNATLEELVRERTRERDQIWYVSQDLLGIADMNGVWQSVNPAWQRALGWEDYEIVGHTSDWLLHPDDHQITQAEIEHLASGAITTGFENRLRRRDGMYRWLAWTAVPSGGLLYCVARDITEAKEHQRELIHVQEQLRHAQKMEAVGQLTGGIAHDFNNLLTGVIGGLDVLQRRLAAQQYNDINRFIDSVTTSAKRAAALTHRLLAFSRRQSLDIKPTDVNQLIVSLEGLIRGTLDENTDLRLDLQADQWFALTDANQLENALLNLCINARDAMPDGGLLTLTTTNITLDEHDARNLGELTAGEYVQVAVSDSGTGMPAEVMARVFEPFYTTKPIGQGTGLGLSMIYGFAQQSGGHIHLASEVGKGTVAQLYLPRSIIETATIITPNTQIDRPRAAANEIVLVVEDDEAVRMVLVEVLDDLGYDAIEAHDGPSALPFLQSDARIDLLISDVGLPGMNGRQLAEIARQHRPVLPVLFVTGYAASASKRAGFLEAGMELIDKPFDIDELAAKIRSMIELNIDPTLS